MIFSNSRLLLTQKKNMADIKFYSRLVLCVLFLTLCCIPRTNSYQFYQQGRLPSGIFGPESFTFDCNEQGPYTGVADGRLFKCESYKWGWTEFATTSPDRIRDICDRSRDPNLEPMCGRPLGIKFNNATCDLYVADAYFGIMKVPRTGGLATSVVSAAGGVSFRFTNSLDIDHDNGIMYFTDSSTRFQRREHLKIPLTGDSSARFMKYDLQTGEVTVLLEGLKFANGVALSKDKTYVLVAETGKSRVLRHWLQGPKANNSYEVFAQLPGAPDNTNRNSKGEFWVALNNGRKSSLFPAEIIGVQLDEEGRILQTLQGDGIMSSISDVKENRGTLFVGSIETPYVGMTRA